ncbi:acyltransferase family protein [Methylobacterium nodulans]|uniref:Acyltransferase 3 n=1 Tax=Methylobacterium nodulans (strain LMG 21967 / CNCM I-2342 / ORS 2060) TaxID=460265 RepID=B8IGJ4_METNO|nr:acyltransferase family protein [Methylobacterium nodulans]ACL55894.1 acyltransferase 3 [Methylobacterium nodulans ORS 2060]
MSAMSYRPDIDGLRGIAVLAVVLCHAEIGAASGGYVGVDVFFVISGFLITEIILREIDAGQFSLAAFYHRRITRILPAFAVMTTVTMVVGALILTPGDLRSLGLSAVAAALSLSNVAFWRSAGYFDTDSAEKPLLHTWSLGVEEQFYLVFPVFVLALTRLSPPRRTAVIGVVLVGSALLSFVAVLASPKAAFYLVPTRAWELLVGSMTAIFMRSGRPPSLAPNALGLVGLAMIVWPILRYDSETRFPGLAAVVPTLGAALVIVGSARAGSPINRLLSAAGLVFIGKISYSLYLWHHPIFAFYRYVTQEEFKPGAQVTLIAASFAVGAASWRWVEVPFRRSYAKARHSVVFVGGGAASSLVCALGLGLFASGGLPQRFEPGRRQFIADNEAIAGEWPYPAACGNYSLSAFAAGGPIRYCRPGVSAMSWAGANSPPDLPKRGLILAWGDSNLEQLYPVFQRWNAADPPGGRQVIMATYGGCPPLLGLNSRTPGFHCGEFNRSVLQRALEADVETVVLGASWTGWIDGWSARHGDNNLCSWPGACTSTRSLEERLRLFREAFGASLGPIRRTGKRIVIILPFPTFSKAVAPYVARAAALGWTGGERLSQEGYRQAFGHARFLLEEVAREYGAEVVDPSLILCEGLSCPITDGGRSSYRDSNHLSVASSLLLEGALSAALAGRELPPRTGLSSNIGAMK